MKTAAAYAVSTVFLLFAAAPAFQASAHHAFASEVDSTAPVVLTGLVTGMEWVNPHVGIHMLVSEAGKPAQAWRVSATSTGSMSAAGVCRFSLKTGATVTVSGWRMKDKTCPDDPATGASVCQASSGYIVFADGRMAGIGYGGAPAGSAAIDPRPCRNPAAAVPDWPGAGH